MPETAPKWMEIFKGGQQKDSAGREHDGDAIIARAVANFNAAEHEPPLVIGHPKENAPAYGWVKELKTEVVGGIKRLFALPQQVAPEFAELIRAGRFKKRSASFYADGRLRHVGFLGAMPPAVKGLADCAFAEDDQAVTFEFGESDGAIARVFRRLREWLIEKEGADTADRIVGDYEINDIQRAADRDDLEHAASAAQPIFQEAPMPTTDPKSFSETDLAAATAKAKEEGRQAAALEFAEQQRQVRATTRKQEILAFCEQGKQAGTIAPAWVDGGLASFMETLDAETTADFGEAGGKKSPYAWFTEFLQAMPKLVDFKEVARRGDDTHTGNGTAGEKLTLLVRMKMADNRDLDYTAAFSEVQREHPELTAQYQEEIS